MPLRPRSTACSVAEPAIGSVLLVTCLVVAGVGVLECLGTVLQAVYPCGETYRTRPSCRIARPDAIGVGYLLMVAVPVACSAAALAVGAWTFARRRPAIVPAVLALALAIAAFQAGRAMVASALQGLVPR